MRTGISRILIAGTTAVSAIALTASMALAATAPTFTVKPGGAYTAKAGKTVLVDNQTHQKLNCKSASAKGKLKKGSHLAGKNIGTITSSSFNSCTGPLQLTFKVKQSGIWNLTVTKFNKSKGVATGFISNVKATLSGPSCKATVTGSTDATFTNKTDTLSVKAVAKSGHVLKISKVTGCLGLINNGNTSNFTGSYKITPKQKISSP
jgi:hypothetical protein